MFAFVFTSDAGHAPITHKSEPTPAQVAYLSNLHDIYAAPGRDFHPRRKPGVKSEYDFLSRHMDGDVLKGLFSQACHDALLNPQATPLLPVIDLGSDALTRTIQSSQRLMVMGLYDQVRADRSREGWTL